MAYQTRSLAELSQQVRGAFRQYLPGTDATLRQNVLYVFAKVLALLSREYELRLAWIYKQLFLSTATDLGIVRMHAADYRIYLKPASAASGSIEGEGAASGAYPAGVRFLSAGTTYVTTAPFTANALGAFAATVRAEQVGSGTNREAGASLSLADAALYPTLGQEAVVSTGGLGGGADIEDIESLRARALDRKATPPKGGALSDYERFALDVPGVVNAWARQFSNGVGTVGLWFLFEGRPNGVPTQSDVDVVQAAVVARRLIRGRFFAIAPVPVAIDLTIRLAPDTAATRAAVTAALQTFFDATLPDTRIRPGLPEEPFLLSEAWLSEVISTAPGENDHTLVAPEETVGFQSGQLPVLGAITWA